MEEGFIKLSRRLMKWEWYQDENTMRVFLHCLLMAQWKTVRFQGMEIPRGSFLTSRQKLAKELKISERSIRTALEHLKSTNELTIDRTAKGSIITVVKYNNYQATDQRADQRPTSDRPATDQRPTSKKKNIKNINNINIYNAHARARETEEDKLLDIEDLYLAKVAREGAADG